MIHKCKTREDLTKKLTKKNWSINYIYFHLQEPRSHKYITVKEIHICREQHTYMNK